MMQSLTLLISVVLVGLAVASEVNSTCQNLCSNATNYASVLNCNISPPHVDCDCEPDLPANISQCLCPSHYCPASAIPPHLRLEPLFQSDFCIDYENPHGFLPICPSTMLLGVLYVFPATTTPSSAQSSSQPSAPATSKVGSSSIGSASATAKTSLPSPTPVSKGLSIGAKAGIAIGVIIGVLIAVVAFLLWRRSRQRKPATDPVAELEVEGRSRYEADSKPIVEADSRKIGPDEDTTKYLSEPDTAAIEKAGAPTTPVSASQFQAQPNKEHYSSHPSAGGLEQTKLADPPSDRGSTLVGTSGHAAGTSPTVPFESPNPSHERDGLSAEAREAEKEKLQRQLSELQEEKERHLRLEEIARQEKELRNRLSALE